MLGREKLETPPSSSTATTSAEEVAICAAGAELSGCCGPGDGTSANPHPSAMPTRSRCQECVARPETQQHISADLCSERAGGCLHAALWTRISSAAQAAQNPSQPDVMIGSPASSDQLMAVDPSSPPQGTSRPDSPMQTDSPKSEAFEASNGSHSTAPPTLDDLSRSQRPALPEQPGPSQQPANDQLNSTAPGQQTGASMGQHAIGVPAMDVVSTLFGVHPQAIQATDVAALVQRAQTQLKRASELLASSNTAGAHGVLTNAAATCAVAAASCAMLDARHKPAAAGNQAHHALTQLQQWPTVPLATMAGCGGLLAPLLQHATGPFGPPMMFGPPGHAGVVMTPPGMTTMPWSAFPIPAPNPAAADPMSHGIPVAQAMPAAPPEAANPSIAFPSHRNGPAWSPFAANSIPACDNVKAPTQGNKTRGRRTSVTGAEQAANLKALPSDNKEASHAYGIPVGNVHTLAQGVATSYHGCSAPPISLPIAAAALPASKTQPAVQQAQQEPQLEAAEKSNVGAAAYHSITQVAGNSWQAAVPSSANSGCPSSPKYLGLPRQTAEHAARDADKLLYKLQGSSCTLNLGLSAPEASRLDNMTLEQVVAELHSDNQAMSPPSRPQSVLLVATASDAASTLLILSRDQQQQQLLQLTLPGSSMMDALNGWPDAAKQDDQPTVGSDDMVCSDEGSEPVKPVAVPSSCPSNATEQDPSPRLHVGVVPKQLRRKRTSNHYAACEPRGQEPDSLPTGIGLRIDPDMKAAAAVASQSWDAGSASFAPQAMSAVPIANIPAVKKSALHSLFSQGNPPPSQPNNKQAVVTPFLTQQWGLLSAKPSTEFTPPLGHAGIGSAAIALHGASTDEQVQNSTHTTIRIDTSTDTPGSTAPTFGIAADSQQGNMINQAQLPAQASSGLATSPPGRPRRTSTQQQMAQQQSDSPELGNAVKQEPGGGNVSKAGNSNAEKPPYRYIVKIGSRWRAQVGQVDGGVQKKFYGPYLDDPASAARDADLILYKLRGPAATTNFPVPAEVQAKLDSMTLAQLLQSFKSNNAGLLGHALQSASASRPSAPEGGSKIAAQDNPGDGSPHAPVVGNSSYPVAGTDSMEMGGKDAQDGMQLCTDGMNASNNQRQRQQLESDASMTVSMQAKAAAGKRTGASASKRQSGGAVNIPPAATALLSALAASIAPAQNQGRCPPTPSTTELPSYPLGPGMPCDKCIPGRPAFTAPASMIPPPAIPLSNVLPSHMLPLGFNPHLGPTLSISPLNTGMPGNMMPAMMQANANQGQMDRCLNTSTNAGLPCQKPL